MTMTNYVKTTRVWARFTAQIPSGASTSNVFPYVLGDYGLGTVSPSGEIPAANAHIGVRAQDALGVYRMLRGGDGLYTGTVIQSPTAQGMHAMPDAWFNVVGSAQLVLTNGSGSGLPATANAVFSVELKG